jgi:hypothetical protein
MYSNRSTSGSTSLPLGSLGAGGFPIASGFTLWLFNIAMGNDTFIDGLPIQNGDFPWRTVK